MNALVFYESFFGNTKQLAETVSEIIGTQAKTELAGLAEAGDRNASEYDLIVIGSPTRAFSASKAMKQAVVKLTRTAGPDTHFAVFDTRMDVAEVNVRILTVLAGWFGYAADTITKILRRKKCTVIGNEGHFFVAGSEGPLKDGEKEKAVRWAEAILHKADGK
ncbi:MAG: hypothetical protein JW874_13835 [Spirochaetales bacterium]|nr:hypothetical protein [Spirochaetales bacterium]